MKLLITFSFNTSLEKLKEYGSLTYFIPLYEEFSKKNIEISFLTYGTHKDLEFSNIYGSTKIIPIYKYVKSRFFSFSLLKSLLLPFKLKNIFQETDLIRTIQIVGCWVPSIGKILYNKKFVLRTGYEWFKFFLLDRATNKKRENILKFVLKYSLYYIIEFIGYKIADGIILTNEQDINFIVKTFKLKKKKRKNKILHLYNYIDIDLFKPLNLTKKDKHVLFIGRLAHQKNVFNLVNAFKGLKDFTLDIIGKGSDENELKDVIREFGINVNFLGVIPNYKIPEILNQYQIFILPSHYEGNPKVLLEAMSCGIPCIGTNVWGINNIIKHKENGYLCKKDSESIRKAILTLYNDNSLREKIGINSRKFVIKNCSPYEVCNKELIFIEKFYKVK